MEGGRTVNSRVEDLAEVWPKIKNVFSVPHTQEEYLNLVSILDDLIDEVGGEEDHPLASLMESIGTLVETYESRNLPHNYGTPVDALRYLMNEHGLKQADMPEIGSQGVVSELLTGRRKLNIRQIKKLSERFQVSPLVFMEN